MSERTDKANIVAVVNYPAPRFRQGEDRMRHEILQTVFEALDKEKAIELAEVHYLDWDDCAWARRDFSHQYRVGDWLVELYGDGNWVIWDFSNKTEELFAWDKETGELLGLDEQVKIRTEQLRARFNGEPKKGDPSIGFQIANLPDNHESRVPTNDLPVDRQTILDLIGNGDDADVAAADPQVLTDFDRDTMIASGGTFMGLVRQLAERDVA